MRFSPARVAFVCGLFSRLVLIAAWPTNYSFDAFQRWGGRDHLLVQSWLPATQLVIHAIASLGGGFLAARIAMAVVASAAGAAGAVLAERLGGRAAGWAFLVPAVYGPFLVWGAALYQEGTFLLVLFAGLALALARTNAAAASAALAPAASAAPAALVRADLVIGALGLVRYEGWPCIALYLVWRRDPRALLATWGMAVWLALHGALGLQGYAASPVDFNDWVGLGQRADLGAWLHDAWRLFRAGFDSGGVTTGVAAVVGVALAWRTRGVGLVVLILLGQVAAVSGWLVGLEVATARMLVVPVVLAGLLGAVGAGKVWERLPKSLRPGLLLIGVILVCVGHLDAWQSIRHEAIRIAPERTLVAEMDKEPDCTWVMTPRAHLGTRSRHDGCEVVQGLSNRRHGEGLWCATWADPAGANLGSGCTKSATWNGTAYDIAPYDPAHVAPAAPALPSADAGHDGADDDEGVPDP